MSEIEHIRCCELVTKIIDTELSELSFRENRFQKNLSCIFLSNYVFFFMTPVV